MCQEGGRMARIGVGDIEDHHEIGIADTVRQKVGRLEGLGLPSPSLSDPGEMLQLPDRPPYPRLSTSFSSDLLFLQVSWCEESSSSSPGDRCIKR